MKPALNTQNLHACAILIGRHGVLIEGASGSGKSTLAHHIIRHYRMAGQLAFWVSDDRTLIDVQADKVIARVPGALAGMAEVHFFGIQTVDHVPSAVLDLAVSLRPVDQLERMRDAERDHPRLPLPLLEVPERACTRAIEVIAAQLATFSAG